MCNLRFTSEIKWFVCESQFHMLGHLKDGVGGGGRWGGGGARLGLFKHPCDIEDLKIPRASIWVGNFPKQPIQR